MSLSSFFRFFEKESHTAYALEALLFFPFRRALCVQGTIMLLRAPEALPRVSERERERSETKTQAPNFVMRRQARRDRMCASSSGSHRRVGTSFCLVFFIGSDEA